MSVSPGEEYWNRRAVAETKAALGCDDPHIASLHVDLATRCVRKVIDERERGEDSDNPELAAEPSVAGATTV